jgi:HK97 gp10 family phage protein
MADLVQVQIEGLDRLAANLMAIPAQLSTRIMREALHAAGDVMAAAAEATAPVLSGALKEDIVVKVHVGADLSDNYVLVGPGYDRSSLTVRGTRRNRRGGIEAVVDTTESPGVYGKFVELGHKTAQAKARSGHEIEFGSHEVPPHPWLAPAFNISREEALETFVAVTAAGLDAVAATMARG